LSLEDKLYTGTTVSDNYKLHAVTRLSHKTTIMYSQLGYTWLDNSWSSLLTTSRDLIENSNFCTIDTSRRKIRI